MGKPVVGQYLKYPGTSSAASRVQSQAVTQLLHLYEQGKAKKGFPHLWGDEIESALVVFEESKKRVELLPKQSRVLRKLDKATEQHANGQGSSGLGDLKEAQEAGYTSEFAKYMVESEPHEPYDDTLTSLINVEESMSQRRTAIKRQLRTTEHVYTISIFPGLGALSRSSKSPKSSHDDLVSKEARYQAADKNINARRERGVDIRVPLYVDSKTFSSFESGNAPDYVEFPSKTIRLQSILFGPGHCGFQVTFQGEDEEEARYLHDQFIPLGPILLALTAATPIYRGYLADTDVRWNQIANAIDDRPLRETQANGGTEIPPPRRWSANETYISTSPNLRPSYQRSPLPINESAKEALEAAGMDPILAYHYAHVLIRDPLIISEADAANTDDSPDNHAHFESLEGTIWPHVRFKLPPHDDDHIGWRVEFRAMETQLTDFENAALAVFMLLVRLAIKRYTLDFYIPIERVQENMERAHPRDAVRQERFWFRRDVLGSKGDKEPSSGDEEEAALMSVDEIVNGSDSFVGLLPLVERYIKDTGLDDDRPDVLRPYLQLIKGRADGSLKTAARWMRDFVRSHADYQHDSYVSEIICYDMMKEVEKMVAGSRDGGMFVVEGSK